MKLVETNEYLGEVLDVILEGGSARWLVYKEGGDGPQFWAGGKRWVDEYPDAEMFDSKQELQVAMKKHGVKGKITTDKMYGR